MIVEAESMEGAESEGETRENSEDGNTRSPEITPRPPASRNWLLPAVLVVLVGVVVAFVYLSPHPALSTRNQGSDALSQAHGTDTPQTAALAEQPPADTPTPAETPTSLPIAAQEGALAPDFTFNDVYTTTDETLWSLRGQPVWINFWATWCQPCNEEMPWIKEVYDSHKADGLRILSMNESDGTQRILDYIKGKDYNWTFAVDWDLDTSHRYGVQGIPVHVFVDKDGVIRTLNLGEMAPGAMEEGVKSILAK